MEISELLSKFDLSDKTKGGDLAVRSPISGETIAQVVCNSPSQVEAAIADASACFLRWRNVPAPRRGELIRIFGDKLRERKDDLGQLVTIECGKLKTEGLGEVQEMIDICDFAVGLSRQLYGYTIASERPGHRLMESWHPIGPIGVISAFNFPVAVWAWNTALAVVCGNSVIWKPSEKTPLTALACQKIFADACAEFEEDTDGLLQVLIGGADVGAAIVDDRRIPVISATGSTRMGRIVGPRVAERFGRSILELGGNNALIVCPSADLDMAVRAVVFGAVGTAGQRCTSTRRVFIHDEVFDRVVAAVEKAIASVKIGNPLDDGVLVGPLIDEAAYSAMQDALDKARSNGGRIIGGEKVAVDGFPGGYYVRPALADMSSRGVNVQEETFAPILYAYRFTDFDEAIALHNDVPQGLSSAIFTTDLREAETFLSARGSDCGIANVNAGTSGAEIGGAFGGEKETGGGRESGSDAWKGYMRRQTSTINYSRALPLAQGVEFDI